MKLLVKKSTPCYGNKNRNRILYFNDTEIPVIWEDNQTVQELMEEADNGDIVVQMALYSDNEQVGSLEKSYTKNDEQITTHNGDITLKIAIEK